MPAYLERRAAGQPVHYVVEAGGTLRPGELSVGFVDGKRPWVEEKEEVVEEVED